MSIPNKRWICSIVRNVDGQLKADVVVVVARNDVLAKAILCEKYRIPNIKVEYNSVKGTYSGEGYKSIRVAETNTFENDTEYDNMRDST